MNQNHLKTIQYNRLYKMKQATKLNQVPINTQYILGEQYRIGDNTGLFKYLYTNNQHIYHNYIKTHSNNNLFELITKDIPKVYFDIDFKHQVFNRKQTTRLIKNFINRFNLILGMNITRNDLVVMVRKETDHNLIKSIHIIMKNYNINKLVLKDIVKNWLGMTDDNGDGFDYKVYTRNRQFCLRHQTKEKYNGKRVFVDYEEKNDNIKDYLINDTENTTNIKTDGGMMNWIKNIYKQAVQNVIVNGDEKVVEYIQSRIEDDLPSLSNPLTIRVNKYNLVKSIVDLLPQTFYLNDKDWKYTTSQMKLHNIENMELWCEKSSDYSNNQYTQDQNADYLTRVDSKYRVNNFVDKVIKRLNRDYNLQLHYTQNLPYDTIVCREWISGITEIDINEINTIFINFGLEMKKPKYITISNDWKFNTETYVLLNVKEKWTYQYWEEYYKQFNRNSEEIENNFTRLDSVDDIKNKTIEFMDNDIRLIAISMKWGMGKSWFCMKEAIEIALNKNMKVLLITENNTLNSQVYSTYKEKYGETMVCNHLKLGREKRSSFNDNDKLVICSQESIKKLNGNTYDLILLDEYESLLNHYESSTFKKITPFQSIEILEQKLKDSEKIILLDADLSIERVKPLTTALSIDKYDLYYCGKNKWSEYTFNIYTAQEFKFIDNLINDLINGKKIALGSQSKSWCEKLEQYIISKVDRKLNIFTIWSDEIKLNDNRLPKKSLENIENIIIENSVDLWIYSPSVKTGLSFNSEEHFNKTYLRANEMSCCGREAIQMLFRVRHLVDKEINISLPKITPPKNIPTENQIFNYLCKNIGLPYTPKTELRDADTNEYKFTISPLYKSIKISNIIESFKSILNLPHEILERLTQNHDIELNYLDLEDDGETIESEDDYKQHLKDIKVVLDNKKINRLVNTELISNKKMIELIKKQEHGLITHQEIDMVNKKLLLNSITWNIGDWNGTKFLKSVYNDNEKIEKIGREYYYNDNGLIQYDIIDYTNTIHNNQEVIEKLYNSKTEHTKLINYSNHYEDDIEREITENAINRENRQDNIYKIVYNILFKFYGNSIYNEDGTIKHHNFKITTKDMKSMIFKNEDDIKKSYDFYESVLYVKKTYMNWKEFNGTNKKHTKTLIKWFYDILGRIGYKITSPKNLNRDNEFYTINKKDNIYTPYQYTKRTTDPIIKDINDKDISVMIKTGKIKIKKTKTWLYKRLGSKWSNESGEWKIVGELTILKDYLPKPIIVKKMNSLDSEDYKNIMKNIFHDPLIGDFYNRVKYHHKIDNNEEIEKYNKNYAKKPLRLSQCLIDDDSDDEDLENHFHNLNKNINTDSDDDDE